MDLKRQKCRTEYKSVTNGAQNTWLRFLYDGYLCVQVLYSNAPYNVFKEFVWDPMESVATRPLVFRYAPNSLNLFYAFDGNKNVSDVFYRMNANGIGAHYDYAPFVATTRTHRDASASFDIVALNPFRFSSEHYDSELDLVYYNYRHYSPSLGRFLSRDPIAEQGGWNLYAFVGNSVSKFVDIRGHKASVIGICSDRVPIVGSHGIANAAEFEVLDFPLSIDAVGGGSFLLKISVSGAIPRMIIRYNKSVFASDSEFRESAVYKHEKQHFEIFKKKYNSFVEEINVYEGWHFNCCRKNFYQES